MRDGYDIFERDEITHIRAWGTTERELFQRALLGLAVFVRPDVAPEKGRGVHIRAHIHGENFSDTLERFLSHVLYESEMHDAVFPAMHVIHLTSQEIECELVGKKIDHREEEAEGVKLTSGGIEKRDGQWEVEFTPELV
ncbi:MAG: archease [Candidatus Sungbacteria bacterium]|uniref:Archease n=1 Tax=Candidatus Sungiibacteriota bacterium TaxID=2750080 RepID=A0A931SD93_9BACT|nr:archease [Candidatus Sungbacteria bacterium]